MLIAWVLSADSGRYAGALFRCAVEVKTIDFCSVPPRAGARADDTAGLLNVFDLHV